MKLHEALLSGKRFKRKDWVTHLEVIDGVFYEISYNLYEMSELRIEIGHEINLSYEWLVADDWEIG